MEEYSRYTLRRIVFISLFVALVAALFLVSLAAGTRELSVGEVYGFLIDHLTGVVYDKETQYELWFDENIIWNYRVPRAIFAIIAGAGLSVAGAAMQSVMKNPLADPYTTGISSGALLGVALAIVLGFAAGSGGIDGYGTILNAMIFSMIPVMMIYIMSPYLNKSPSTLILAGTAVSYLFSSLTSSLLVTTEAETLHVVYKWQVGNMADLSWDAIPVPLIICVAGTLVLLALSNKLNLMSLDDKDAKALGLDGEKLRLVCLLVLSFMASSII
ncbi:MAG: iron ABC transporter permease, partial [Candidatus Methanomethylophilaceae archaeon]|nr:iron ABC transporter permease [Candidatus Methanomethylophilaceae archaeon]